MAPAGTLSRPSTGGCEGEGDRLLVNPWRLPKAATMMTNTIGDHGQKRCAPLFLLSTWRRTHGDS